MPLTLEGGGQTRGQATSGRKAIAHGQTVPGNTCMEHKRGGARLGGGKWKCKIVHEQPVTCANPGPSLFSPLLPVSFSLSVWCTAGDEAAAQQQGEKQLAGTRAVAAAGREAAAAVAVVVVAQARERARREELAYWPGLDWHKAVVCLWRGGLGRRTKGSPGFSLSASLGTGFR